MMTNAPGNNGLAHSPTRALETWRGSSPPAAGLGDYEAWWRAEGLAISRAIDAQGTPALRMHDRWGQPEDHVLYPPEYRHLLGRGYRAGVIAAAVEHDSLLPGYQIGYVTSWFDPGLYCPYTVSLGTLVPLLKYAPAPVRDRFVPAMTRRDDDFWQGATWMTEVGGGSDIGTHVHTRARRAGVAWRLDGEKYFCSNVNAELAVVAARPEGAADGVRGLALFLAPRRREDGRLNYRIRRLKDKIATRSVPTGEIVFADSEAWLLGQAEQGIYQIMEVLNTSRVANSIGAAALVQRALAEAESFAEQRQLFGRSLREQPLFARECRHWHEQWRECFALAWEAADLLDGVWRETPPYSSAYHRFRLLAHLAKFHTADRAVAAARWAMEAHGGNGVLHEYDAERLLREAMILAIWEGTPHRQMLDGLEVMARQQAHEALFAHLGEPTGSQAWRERIGGFLARPVAEREAEIEPLFRDLAAWTARELARKRLPATG